MGATESLLLTDPFVVTLLRNFCRGRLPGDRLSSHSPGLLRKRLADTLEQLGLVVPYRWYSVCRPPISTVQPTTLRQFVFVADGMLLKQPRFTSQTVLLNSVNSHFHPRSNVGSGNWPFLAVLTLNLALDSPSLSSPSLWLGSILPSLPPVLPLA